MNFLIIITIAVITVSAIAVALWITRTFRHEFCVPEGRAGLLYHHGLYVRRNNAGRHVIWGRGWTINLIDLRRASCLVPGEEIITANYISLVVSLNLTWQITDPARAAHETQHCLTELCSISCRTLHAVLGNLTVEELLRQRSGIEAQLLAHARPEAARIGINLLAIDLRRVVLPEDLKCAFVETLKAKPVVSEVHEVK